MLTLLLGAGLAFASPTPQPCQNPVTQTVQTEEYCRLVVNAVPFSNRESVALDYSQKFPSQINLAAEAKKIQAFGSLMDALNYMGSKGWELVTSYSITASQQHYLLRRKVRLP